jgi:hypothetical protein
MYSNHPVPTVFELDGDGEVIPSAAALLPRWSKAKRPAKI